MRTIILTAALLLSSAAAAPFTAHAMTAATEQHRGDGNHRGDKKNADKKNRAKDNHTKWTGADKKHNGSSQARPGWDNRKPDKNKVDHKNHGNNKGKNHGNKDKNQSHKDKNHGVKPGHNSSNRPGYTPSHRPGHNASSAPRPGSGSHPGRHDNGLHKGHFKWRPVPKPPRRPVHIHHYHPVRPSVLGLTFGTVFNIALNSLQTGGFDVVYAADNLMSLANILQYGVTWPQAQVFYGPAGMSGARFSYFTPSFDPWAFNTAYAQLVAQYGQPESVTRKRNSMSAVWWCGGDTYITLNSGRSSDIGGYSTDLIFGM